MASTRQYPAPAILGGTPLFPRRPWPPVEGVAEAVAAVADSGRWAYNSPAEVRAAARFGRLQAGETDSPAYVLLGTNCTHWLQLMLEAAHIGAGDEVITTVQSWQAAATASLDVNAVPVMVGTLPGTNCLDPDQVERAITPRTKAIVAVHLYGSMAEMDRLGDIAAAHKLALFEDCAHAQGARWGGKGAGMVSDGGTFSFFLDKNLPAGEGGAALTKWAWLADRLDAARNCGRPPEQPRHDGRQDLPNWWWLHQFDTSTLEPSGNYRIGAFQAAVLDVMCKRFPGLNEERLAGRADLNAALRHIRSGGVQVFQPADSQPRVTVPPTYAYVVRYSNEAYGLPASGMREILSAEMGRPVEPVYQPLSDNALYLPQSKPRHQLGRDYLDRITPAAYRDPVADQSYREAFRFHHTTQFEGAGERLVELFVRIGAHQDELRRRFVA